LQINKKQESENFPALVFFAPRRVLRYQLFCKRMNKTLRTSPSNSHPLFEKSGAKTLTLKPKIVRTHDFNKVLMKLFQKFLGFGVKPQGFDLHALIVPPLNLICFKHDFYI